MCCSHNSSDSSQIPMHMILGSLDWALEDLQMLYSYEYVSGTIIPGILVQ